MEKDYKKYWFFGSKLNTVLLCILIILMIIALKWMFQDRARYFPLSVVKENIKAVPGDSMSDTEADLFDTFSTPNPKLSNIIGYDGNQLGQSQVEGNSKDLVSFSIKPTQEVSGMLQVLGSVKGGYFFEANILVNILDVKKNLLKAGHASAAGEWMTSAPVSFAIDLDFTGLPKGPAYIEIHNDNASGLPKNDKSILIPIVIN